MSFTRPFYFGGFSMNYFSQFFIFFFMIFLVAPSIEGVDPNQVQENLAKEDKAYPKSLKGRTTYDRHYHYRPYYSKYRGYKYYYTYPRYQYYYYDPYYYYYERAPGVYFYYRA